MNRLRGSQWGKLYSSDNESKIIEQIEKKNYSAQTLEMLKIAEKNKGKKFLEIGCGSGQTAICLAMYGCEVTAMDYQEESLYLIENVMGKLGRGGENRMYRRKGSRTAVFRKRV